MLIQRPCCFFNIRSSCSSRPNQLRWDCLLPPPVAGCAAGQASRPHHILASLACLSLYSPTPPVIFRRWQQNQSTLVLSTVWAATAVSSPAPCRSLRRPCRRPPPWCSRRGVVNDVHPTAVVLLQPLVFLPQPPKAAPLVPHAPASRGRLCCRGGLTAPYYSHRWPGHPSSHPHPLLFCGNGSLTPQPNE